MCLHSSNLNALYTGRNQHTNEHGVNRNKKKIESPNVTPADCDPPLFIVAMKYAREPMTFIARVPTYAAIDTYLVYNLIKSMNQHHFIF